MPLLPSLETLFNITYFSLENPRQYSMLNAGEQKELIDVARKSIRRQVCGGPAQNPEELPQRRSDDDPLYAPSGAFVTIYKREELRGCLGLIVSEAPLVETVAELAARAATEDPRFASVSEEELDDVHVEISILSPFTEIFSIDEINVGTHGLFIQAGMYRGLLLPQVAVTHHWDKVQFIEETCVKAGLPRDQWKHAETKIFIFSAEIVK